MSLITRVRPVLLSAPYATPNNLEVRFHLPAGVRTCGLVEVTLDDGTTGLGEGYLAVFAPEVFRHLVLLLAPNLIGKEASEIRQRYREMCLVCDYWSQEGAARHAISAIETALVDAGAKQRQVPAWRFLGGAEPAPLHLYGSGGDSATPEEMAEEVALLSKLGLRTFKIRARPGESCKAAWTLEHAGRSGMAVAVDMVQNLAYPGQRVEEALAFLQDVRGRTGRPVAFLEEALGLDDLERYPHLRSLADVKIAGGEIVTTARELSRRVGLGFYDYAQPDVTVVGGMLQALEVFAACRSQRVEAVVHCWGGAVGLMANYHVAFAGGAKLAEWPMPRFELREALFCEPLRIRDGSLQVPCGIGLGVSLTPEIEKAYAFRPDTAYRCLVPQCALPADSVWTDGARP
jgi:L-alanine-DL-glutamate epimerase-like enolase superfamily enzyme